MKTAVFAMTFAVWPIWGQIVQSHPEYCGIPGYVNPPLPDISATIDQDGHAVVYVGRRSSARGIPLSIIGLPSSIREIEQLCPLSDGRLVVFGDFGGTYVYIIDKAKASLVDSFVTYFPAMSPDQRWIVYDKFYPLHGVEATSELLIYDLTKTPAQNRLGDDPAGVGRLIFPPGQSDVPYDNIGVPMEQAHRIGRRVYWAADSRAFLFTDQFAGHRSIVLVTLDDRGVASAFEHEITVREICGQEIPGMALDWSLSRVEIGPDRTGSRSIIVDIGPDYDLRCPFHVLQLQKADFRPAKPEIHIREEPWKGIIMDGRELIPPKKRNDQKTKP